MLLQYIYTLDTLVNNLSIVISDISFQDVIGIIGIIASVLIILAVSIRSVVDVLRATGVFYFKWMDFIYRNEDKRIEKVLRHLGVLPKVKNYKSLTLALDAGFAKMSEDEIKFSLYELAKKFTEEEELIVGDKTALEVKYFLNLRKAFLVGHAKELVDIICTKISVTSVKLGIDFDCVVSRKTGFDLLGYYVADAFRVPFVVCHDKKSIVKGNTIKAFDYIPDDVKKPILVDDSCVGGSGLAEMADDFKRATTIGVEHAFIIFTRNPNSKDRLTQSGVTLHYIESYSDDDLRELLNNRDSNNAKKKVITTNGETNGA